MTFNVKPEPLHCEQKAPHISRGVYVLPVCGGKGDDAPCAPLRFISGVPDKMIHQGSAAAHCEETTKPACFPLLQGSKSNQEKGDQVTNPHSRSVRALA